VGNAWIVGLLLLSFSPSVTMTINPGIFTAQRYANAVYAIIVCLSVSPSITCRCYIKTAIHRNTQTTRCDSPGNLVFWRQRSRRNSNGGTK